MKMAWRSRMIAALVGVVVGMATGGVAHAGEVGVQIDSGGAGGNGFLPDSYVTGGATDTNRTGGNGLPNWSRTVAHPIPQEQWNTFRFLESSYRVPGLTPGASYEVRLYFDDWYWSKVGQRAFDVAVNGTVVLNDFDIIQTVVTAGGDGRNLGVEKDFTVTAGSDGTIAVDLIRGPVDQPLINAIAVVPVG
ncbi:malectin domain-containing carbohydrate-binding protein [Actinoplanes sp. NPDC049265]|uniref:malectin domain-containing carbohydrate-binding protein n=1 Tax=Actinoplanes sp. NPDC049265 TaxID=3363902 RepID=UPI00371DF9B5